MTIAKCKKFCADKNYNYAGVEFAKQCFCGNDRPNILAPETDCSMPCTGNKSETCGAGHRINVYQLGNEFNISSRLNYFVKNLFRAQARVGKDWQGMAHKAKGLKA